MVPVSVFAADGPVVLGLPHAGTWLPPQVHASLNERGKLLTDTDWHVDKLYQGLLPGATMVRANFHRYVVDANRDPAGTSLYPGQNTTGLVPLTDFDDNAIWLDGREPGAEEIASRVAAFHAPYHAALAGELERVCQRHGVALLYDCHSIRSHVPFLFDGKLPDFNIGTNDGTTCDPRIASETLALCAEVHAMTHVLNGRFKGGWTTRHYGRPQLGVHAIQMELAQSTHLASEAPPFDLDPAKAKALRSHLAQILSRLETVAFDLAAARRTDF